jgi:hypothetical protein
LLTIQHSSFRSPPDIPEVQISEDLAVNVALRLRADINKALGLLREISLGHDLMKFLGVNLKEPFFGVLFADSLQVYSNRIIVLMFQVIIALWILSEVGELCELLRLMYIGNGSLSSENSALVILSSHSCLAKHQLAQQWS